MWKADEGGEEDTYWDWSMTKNGSKDECCQLAPAAQHRQLPIGGNTEAEAGWLAAFYEIGGFHYSRAFPNFSSNTNALLHPNTCCVAHLW